MPIIFVDHSETPPSTAEPPKTPEVRPVDSVPLAEIGSNIDASQENLDNEDYDATWGGRKSRYIYDYAVEDTSDNSDDTDQTESVLSIQSKTTLLLESESDAVAGCPSNCECRNPNHVDREYEPISSSSSGFKLDDSNYSSDSTVLMDYKYPKKMIKSESYHSSSDTGYFADEVINHDDHVTTKDKKLPPPACFKICLQCKKENSNAYFQYCYTCFKNRMDFFEEKPKPKKKKRCNSTIHTKFSNSFVDYQKPGPSNSHQSAGSLNMNQLLSQKKIDQSANNIDNDSIEMRKKTTKICKVCFIMPQNGVFNHGKVGHIYSCYPCTKKLFKQSKKCPVCSVKVKFITKMIVV